MRSFLSALLRSYSLLFFSQHLGVGALLLAASFGAPVVGALGLATAAVAVAGARVGTFSRALTDVGALSFNALLVGLLLGATYAPGWPLLAVAAVGAGLALGLAVVLGDWLGGRGLPALSLPFGLTMWLLTPALRALVAAGHLRPAAPDGSLDALLLAIDRPLTAAAPLLAVVAWPPALTDFLRALSAVLVQDSVAIGALVAVALLWHSRIAFGLAVGAFGLAVALGQGAQAAGLADTLPAVYDVGANYLLTAVAVGTVWLVPRGRALVLGLATVPLAMLVLSGLTAGLAPAGLVPYSVPFALTALVVLGLLKGRETPSPHLALVAWQHYSPEQNLYAATTPRHTPADPRFTQPAPLVYLPLRLPFLGAWTCSQTYADPAGPTHHAAWAYALDFLIRDSATGLTYTGPGLRLTDYRCYDQPVLAPADGTVETVIDHLPDNPIGVVNTRHNWGNTVVLRLADGLYAQLSHLRPGSALVKPGQAVRRGQELARCGSSGRSPEPHLHFQLQTSPTVGAPTVPYPLAAFVEADEPCAVPPPASGTQLAIPARLHRWTIPAAGATVRAPVPDPQLRMALALPPGTVLLVRNATVENAVPTRWEVHADPWNQRYLRCQATGAVAYFEADDEAACEFRFTSYYGPRTAALYAFFRATYRVPLGAPAGYLATDAFSLPQGRVPAWLRALHDVAAPFGTFVRVLFAGEVLTVAPRRLTYRSRVVRRIFGRETAAVMSELLIQDGAVTALRVQPPRGAALHLTFEVE